MFTAALSRRHFLHNSLVSLSVSVPPLLATETPTLPAEETETAPAPEKMLKVTCVGAHPDDPESGCGGALARYAEAGHRVSVIYLTRGERGIRDKSLEEAATIRTAEAEAACKILGAKPLFAGQIDGATELTPDRAAAFSKLLWDEQPDVVFAHWPLDTHGDHQISSLLTVRAYLTAPRPFLLYFFEVNSGAQTKNFIPTDYLDITAVQEKKKAALFAHKSQDGEEIFRAHHGPMASFRGREIRVAAAEAFVAMVHNRHSGSLPGL